nr:hypothetical protein [Mesorhizobium sp. Root695]
MEVVLAFGCLDGFDEVADVAFLIHWVMLKRPAPEQTALEMVTLDQLVPADHLLRKIDRVIDFSFIHELTAPL